ncbi:MAG: hypothetical protein ACE5JI_03105, partial [Acidobacteriota bacterium]
GHVRALEDAVAEMGRVLTAGGALVYSDFHPLGALAGWKRTFWTQGRQEYEVPHHVHLYEDHHAACRSAGLMIEEVREPRIEPQHPWRGYPAVLIIRARKARPAPGRRAGFDIPARADAGTEEGK